MERQVNMQIWGLSLCSFVAIYRHVKGATEKKCPETTLDTVVSFHWDNPQGGLITKGQELSCHHSHQVEEKALYSQSGTV